MGSGKGGGRKNNNGGNNKNGGLLMNEIAIPLSSKKVIESIKEIVNFPDDEIYLMLKDCNMDPSDAVNRLLSQDTFHQVKSKRDKKKDVTDSRSRANTTTSTRPSRGSVHRYSTPTRAINNTTHFVSSDRGKPVYNKETGPPLSRYSTMGVAGNDAYCWQTAASDTYSDKTFSINATESLLPTPQPSGFQSACSGMSAQLSMADIVKMGRPHGKASTNFNPSQQRMTTHHAMPSLPALSQNYASKVSEENSESGIAGHQNVPLNEEWPRDEDLPAASFSSTIEPPVDSEPYSDPYGSTNQQFKSHVDDDVRFEEDDTVDDEHATFVGSIPGSHQNIQENNSVNASGFGDDVYQNIASYQVHNQGVDDPNLSASSITKNFESLSLPKNDEEDAPYEDEDEDEDEDENEDSQSEDDGPAVKIPDHLQVQTADLSHLSFGSFGSATNAPFSGSYASRPVHSNVEETAATTDVPLAGHSEVRNAEYYGDDHLRTVSDVNSSHRMGANSDNFEAPPVSQADMLQQEAPEVTQANQYAFPSSTANYTYENNQQLNSSFAHSPASSQMMQGLPSLAGVMPYSNSLPSTLLASNMQPLREAELAYSQFPISQSMAAKYGNSASSHSGPTASMAEALRASNLAAQPTQTLPGGSVSGPTGLPQHLAMHAYSQHSVPLGPLNMMGYPFLPQTYAYMPPSAYQQAAFATGNSGYPQSLAAAGFPQFKNSNSLPQSGSVPSGYVGFGNSNNIPSDLPMNPPSAPPGTSINYDDVLASQYKDASHLLSLHQGGGSRTMSGIPGSTYYSLQGQNQQAAGFRQSQQPTQHYAPQSAYPNYYHSQGGLTLDHHQQMARDSGSRAQQPKQTQQQMWQNNY